jgi:hypothetical protein
MGEGCAWVVAEMAIGISVEKVHEPRDADVADMWTPSAVLHDHT